MRTRYAPALACGLAVLALAPAARAGDTDMRIGAAEDAAKTLDLVTATAKMDLARLVGFDAVRLTSIWAPGQTEVAGYELAVLQNAAAAAALTGIHVYLSVYHHGSRTTPRTPAARRAFASYAASIARQVPGIKSFIIGNEPNLNRFWMPQFNRDGSSASPGGYLGLLAVTYDALKDVSADIEVIGGSISPRGGDNPRAKRHTHSPTGFIRALGRVYRASGRNRPVMDAFAFHPYGDNSSQPPDFLHLFSKNIGLADYGKLVGLLGEAFDGTAQPGSQLPIVYDEYGIDTRIPSHKRLAYKGREPTTTRPVDEATQGRYYRQALALAYCQPTVKAFLIFHVSDEPDLDRWQSGLYYADDTPKASLPIVRDAVEAARRGTLTKCVIEEHDAVARFLSTQKPPLERRVPRVPPGVFPR
jgi:hypothetical protein